MTIFNYNCRDIKAVILKNIILDTRTLNCRLVCKDWKDVIDKDVFKIFLVHLKNKVNEIPLLGLRSIVVSFTDEVNPSTSMTFQCDIAKFKNFNRDAEIGQCNQLMLLAVDNNKIQKIPPEFGNCTQVKCVNLENNPIENLPPTIANCSKLQLLSVNGCNIYTLPQEMKKNCSQLIALGLIEDQLLYILKRKEN